MNTACLSPLIKEQPKPFVDAAGANHGHVVVYKDEGGQYTYHYPMRVSVPHTTQKISVAAYTQCTNTMCAQHCDVSGCTQFVSDKLFSVMDCSRAGHRGPLVSAPTPVAEWEGKPNVWSYVTFMDTALDIKCNFWKVTSKCMCGACGGETQFKIAVATDQNCVDVSLPIRVMSKRKIPASMRKKSQREIKAFMEKTRHKKCVKQEGRKRKSDAVAVVKARPALKIKAPRVPQNRPVLLEDTAVLSMTEAQKFYYIKEQDANIQRLESELERLEAELAKQKKLVAATKEQKNKRLKIATGRDERDEQSEFVDTPVNVVSLCSTPDTFFQFPSSQDNVLEPLSLFGDRLEDRLDDRLDDDISKIPELDFDGWDIEV